MRKLAILLALTVIPLIAQTSPGGCEGVPSLDSLDPAGAVGAQGEAGPAGPQGPTGESGPEGPAGPKGEAGPQASAGPQGDTGPQGAAGPQGTAGPQGEPGSQGAVGPQGPTGASPFSLNGSDAVFATGNVGIGTTTPSSMLTVAGFIESTANGFKFPDASTLNSSANLGDIKSVIAGTGLTGGGTSGDVTLNLDFAGTGSAVTPARSDHKHFSLDAADGAPTAALTLDNAGNVAMTQNTTVGGTLGVTGATTLSTLSTSGAATLSSATVTNNATVGGTLGVTGATTLSTLSTSGAATLSSAAVTNNATVGGTLNVTGTVGTPAVVTPNIGTSSAATLNLMVASTVGLRMEPTSGTPNLIGGYSNNEVTSGVFGAVIGGGGVVSELNRVTDHYGFIGGGALNRAGDDTGTTGDRPYATVAGGTGNTASGWGSAISGGQNNVASGTGASIGGGRGHQSSNANSTVGGGYQSTASGVSATVGGGQLNLASGDGATVAGGQSNIAGSIFAAVGGGDGNTASGYAASIAGGGGNSASGVFSMIPGGQSCAAAEDYAFAAGRRAKANHAGAFVWADSTDADFTSATANRFYVRAAGGAAIYSAGDLSTGVTLAAGGGSWAMVSDRNAKENLSPVDPLDVLERVRSLPLSTWNYIAQDDSIRHIGPMAQDFYAAFDVGEDERHITSIDADGVALAAIQGLSMEVDSLRATMQEMEARHAAALRSERAHFEDRIAGLEQLVRSLVK